MTIQIPPESKIVGLSSPLSRIVELYHEMGLVGEERNIPQLFVTAITRHLPRKYRRHMFPRGSSGSGKTTLVSIVLSVFGSDVERYTRVTGASLERKKNTLNGKILFLEQVEGTTPEQLRYLVSEGKLRILYVDHNGVSRSCEVGGGPVIFSTVVGTVADPQLSNRISTLEIDESQQQTSNIIHQKLALWTNIQTQSGKDAFQELQHIDALCKQLGSRIKEIMIPFGSQLEGALPKILSMRRGVDRLLSLVAAIAFLKAALGMRPQVKEQNSIYVTALPEDLNDALYCLGETFSDSLRNFNGRYKEVYETLRNNSSASCKEIARNLQMGETTARDHLNSLLTEGLATRTRDKCGIYRYKATPQGIPQLKLEVNYTESDLRNWVAQQFPSNTAHLTIPEEALTAFERPKPVQGRLPTDPNFATIQQTGQETGTNGEIVPDNTSGETTTVTRH